MQMNVEFHLVTYARGSCQLLCVNATGVQVRHAEVEPLDHVGGVVSHFPLGQAISQVQLVCHVKVANGRDVFPSASVSKQRSEQCPPTKRFKVYLCLFF